MSHPIVIYDGDMMFREFARDIAVNLDRLNALGCMPVAVVLREDLWPDLTNWDGYPIQRLSRQNGIAPHWGVLV